MLSMIDNSAVWAVTERGRSMDGGVTDKGAWARTEQGDVGDEKYGLKDPQKVGVLKDHSRPAGLAHRNQQRWRTTDLKGLTKKNSVPHGEPR
jgi:hypothetical protein